MYVSKLWIENTSEIYPRSYEATKAVVKKSQKKSEASKGIWTHDLRHVLVQCSTNWAMKPLLVGGQVQVQFIAIEWREYMIVRSYVCTADTEY